MESITKTVHLAGGETVEFPRLTLTDLFSIGDAYVANRERVARELAKEEKLSQTDVYNVVLDIRARRPELGDLIQSCYTPDGAHVVLKRSMTKAGLDAAKQDAVVARMAIPQCVEVAQMLVGDVQEERNETAPLSGPAPSTSAA